MAKKSKGRRATALANLKKARAARGKSRGGGKNAGNISAFIRNQKGMG
jgi:hypothetical protein